MSRFILHQAVACGGTARGFNQGAGSVACAVYASEWVAYQLTGQADPFDRTVPVTRAFTCPVRHFPGLYEDGLVVGNQVVVTVADSAPDAEYAIHALEVKKLWGTMGGAILNGAARHLSQRIAPRKAALAGDQLVGNYEEDHLEKWFSLLLRPDFNLVALSPKESGPNHLTATWFTETEFRMFDSLVGELVLPSENLRAWFDTDKVQDYFAKRSTVWSTALILD